MGSERRAWVRAGVKIVVTAALAGGVYLGYRHYVQIRHDVAVLIDGPGGKGGGIRSEMAKDTPAGLLRAEKLLEEVLRIHSRNAFGIVALADVETQLVGLGYTDRAQRAEETRRKADEKRVSFAELFDAHALALLQAGKAAEAEAYARSLLQKYPALPAVPRFHDLLGRAERALGKLAEARASFRRAQEADWRQPRFIADYAEALLEDGDAGAAFTAFDRALRANPDHLRSLIGKARAQIALTRDGRGDAKAARGVRHCVVRVLGHHDPALHPRMQVAGDRHELGLGERDRNRSPARLRAVELRVVLAQAVQVMEQTVAVEEIDRAAQGHHRHARHEHAALLVHFHLR